MVGECMIWEKASNRDAFDSATDFVLAAAAAAAVYSRAGHTPRHIVLCRGWAG